MPDTTPKTILVSEWRSAWRWWSVQLAAVFGIVAGVLAANPTLLLGLLAFMPTGPLRYLAAAGVAIVVFVIPVIVRLAKQGPKDG